MNLSRLMSFVSEMVSLMIRQGSGRCWAFRHVATRMVSPLEAIVSLPCLFWTRFLSISPEAHRQAGLFQPGASLRQHQKNIEWLQVIVWCSVKGPS